MYLQESLNYLNHKRGDFPVTDEHTKKIISFPCDQHLSLKQMNYIINTVKNFYKDALEAKFKIWSKILIICYPLNLK